MEARPAAHLHPLLPDTLMEGELKECMEATWDTAWAEGLLVEIGAGAADGVALGLGVAFADSSSNSSKAATKSWAWNACSGAKMCQGEKRVLRVLSC